MKVCIWGNLSGAFTGKTAGGGEKQMALLAISLTQAGHEVVIIDFSTNESFVTSDGIKVLKIEGWNNGIRIIRTFTHRLPLLYSSLKKAKADVYYSRLRDFRHILAFWAARKVKGKFVMGLASDLDVMSFGKRLKYYYLANIGRLWWFFSGILIEIIYPFLMRKADLIMVQHEGQRDLLLNKRIESIIFPNLIDESEIPTSEVSNPEGYIYVGALDKRKGFAEFFELVKKAPLKSFKVIGKARDKTGHYYLEKLKSMKNVSLLGRLNHRDTLTQINNSKALISTSPMEGFPNTFIEAWACGKPVLSLYVDPGHVIERERIGISANGSIDSLVAKMDAITNDTEIGKRAKNYVSNNHILNYSKVRELSAIFENLILK